MKPVERNSWETYGKRGWYIGHVKKAQVPKIYAKKKNTIIVSGTVKLFPTYNNMAKLSLTYAEKYSANDLI